MIQESVFPPLSYGEDSVFGGEKNDLSRCVKGRFVNLKDQNGILERVGITKTWGSHMMSKEFEDKSKMVTINTMIFKC